VKLTWGNGEAAYQTVSVSVLSDKLREGDETFSVVLSEPTGGAVLGKSSVTATITDTRPAGSGSGGGGSTGVLTLLALGFARLIRTRRA
jgi:MYXO-CTERM domain-containing protein